MFLAGVLSLLAGARLVVAALQVDWDSNDSIKQAASVMASDAMSFYEGDKPGRAPGLVFEPPRPDPWWWAGSVLFAAMIEYAHYTDDHRYDEVVKTAVAHQAGADQNFLTPNWTTHAGNDDVGFWGLAAMRAAETRFVDPPPGQPQWLATAQGVFNAMTYSNGHDQECGGGLRWQRSTIVKGFDYKNSISNGLYFDLGARLARYTANNTYAELATRIWDWAHGVGLITNDWAVLDGVRTGDDCSKPDMAEYTYNMGVWLHGAAFMYNITEGSSEWQHRVAGLLDHGINKFFPKNVTTEIVCQNEIENLCERDSTLFKGVFVRLLATIAQVAPFTSDKIQPLLLQTAKSVVSQCSGGGNGHMCGFQWASGQFSGRATAGTQMSSLGAVLSVLVARERIPPPVTESTGGTSKGNPGAGFGSQPKAQELAPITTGSKVAAGFLTLFFLASLGGIQTWMVIS